MVGGLGYLMIRYHMLVAFGVYQLGQKLETVAGRQPVRRKELISDKESFLIERGSKKGLLLPDFI